MGKTGDNVIPLTIMMVLLLGIRLPHWETRDRPWRIYVDDPEDAETHALLLSFIPHEIVMSPIAYKV